MDPVASSQVRLQAPTIGKSPTVGSSAVRQPAPSSQVSARPSVKAGPLEEGGVRTERGPDGSISRSALSLYVGLIAEDLRERLRVPVVLFRRE